MRRPPTDSIGPRRQRGTAIATLTAVMVAACATTHPAPPPAGSPLAAGASDSAGLLIKCARTETARLGYQPVEYQQRSASYFYDVDNPADARWFVAEPVGPRGVSPIRLVAEARRDADGRWVLLATAVQSRTSSHPSARESASPIRRSVSWASTRGTEPAPIALPPELRADVESLRAACASPASTSGSNDGLSPATR